MSSHLEEARAKQHIEAEAQTLHSSLQTQHGIKTRTGIGLMANYRANTDDPLLTPETRDERLEPY